MSMYLPDLARRSPMLSRALLLLCCLAAGGIAAPAPLARRERQPTEVSGWSAIVDGLRVRLVAEKASYKAGETIRMVMEIQNARSTALSLSDPSLASSVYPPDRAPPGWSITGMRVDPEQTRCRRSSEESKRESAWTLLPAGESIRIEI